MNRGRFDRAEQDWREDVWEVATGLLERGAAASPDRALEDAIFIVQDTRAKLYAELLEKVFPNIPLIAGAPTDDDLNGRNAF